MTTFNTRIDDWVVGDDAPDVVRTITSLPAGQTITKAWLTVKLLPADADPGIFQKDITSSYVVGKGQITDTGADGTGAVSFEVLAANTVLLNTANRYYYDIQIKLANGRVYAIEVGTVVPKAGITAATV
jgi:hypothetical protein